MNLFSMYLLFLASLFLNVFKERLIVLMNIVQKVIQTRRGYFTKGAQQPTTPHLSLSKGGKSTSLLRERKNAGINTHAPFS